MPPTASRLSSTWRPTSVPGFMPELAEAPATLTPTTIRPRATSASSYPKTKTPPGRSQAASRVSHAFESLGRREDERARDRRRVGVVVDLLVALDRVVVGADERHVAAALAGDELGV